MPSTDDENWFGSFGTPGEEIMSVNIQYREGLPPACPPIDAVDADGSVFWRLFPKDPITSNDFDSQYHKDNNRKFPDDCEARAVSLFTTKEKCEDIRKFRRMSHLKYVASVEISPGSGKYKVAKSGHVNWWIYQKFDPLASCSALEIAK